MKKWMSLLWAAVLCFALCACGSEDTEDALIGQWKSLRNNDVVTFQEDGKLLRGEETFSWWYDEGNERYMLSFYDSKYSFTIENEDDICFIKIEDVLYYHEDDFEEVYALYMEALMANLTDGKTKMVVGETYTLEGGVEFTFEKAEITGEGDDCKFNIYLTCEESLTVAQVAYDSFSGRNLLGLPVQEDGSEGNTVRYAGGSLEMKELKVDKDEYGILAFTINGEKYYVSIETFFE